MKIHLGREGDSHNDRRIAPQAKEANERCGNSEIGNLVESGHISIRSRRRLQWQIDLSS
jgi:hypothetical protein